MAITQDEQQNIINAVLSSIRTNSRTIEQLTPVTSLSDNDSFEIDGSKRVTYAVLRDLIVSLLSAEQDMLKILIGKKELKTVSITTSEDSATLSISSVGKTIATDVPVATTSKAGFITAADKLKLERAFDISQQAKDIAADAISKAETAQSGVESINSRLDTAMLTLGHAAGTAYPGDEGAENQRRLDVLEELIGGFSQIFDAQGRRIEVLESAFGELLHELADAKGVITLQQAQIESLLEVFTIPALGVWDDNLPWSDELKWSDCPISENCCTCNSPSIESVVAVRGYDAERATVSLGDRNGLELKVREYDVTTEKVEICDSGGGDIPVLNYNSYTEQLTI